jgi:hypothetical protein
MAKKVKKKKPIRTKKTAKPKEKSSAGTGSTTSKQQLEETKPEFEQSLQDHNQPTAAEPGEKVETRGGARPGAGRPRGTDDLALVNRLPEKANETLVPVLQIPFKTWATAVGVKELELTKEDAKDLALPVTQLLEFYFPGRIPEIAWVWLMMLGSTYRILEPRLELLAQKRKENGPSVAPGDKGPAPSSRPQTGAADPAAGYPKEK